MNECISFGVKFLVQYLFSLKFFVHFWIFCLISVLNFEFVIKIFSVWCNDGFLTSPACMYGWTILSDVRFPVRRKTINFSRRLVPPLSPHTTWAEKWRKLRPPLPLESSPVPPEKEQKIGLVPGGLDTEIYGTQTHTLINKHVVHIHDHTHNYTHIHAHFLTQKHTQYLISSSTHTYTLQTIHTYTQTDTRNHRRTRMSTYKHTQSQTHIQESYTHTHTYTH